MIRNDKTYDKTDAINLKAEKVDESVRNQKIGDIAQEHETHWITSWRKRDGLHVMIGDSLQGNKKMNTNGEMDTNDNSGWTGETDSV